MSVYKNEALYLKAIDEMKKNPYIDFTLSYFHKKYNFDPVCFSKYLKEKNIKMNGSSQRTTEKSKKYYKIAQEYLKNDKPAYYYADKYNISQKTFYNYLHEKGLAKITANYNKQTCNENFFETIDSEEKAYWLGFIFADGCVRGRDLTIELSDIDVGHLIKFKKSICATNNISKRKNRPTVVIEICKKKLVKDLAKYVCIKNKTYNGWIDQSLIDDKYKRHFLRGFLDGDGYIERKNYRKYRIIYTVWSENIKNTIMDMLSDFHPICTINNSIKNRQDLSIFRISIGRKKIFLIF